MFWLLSGPLGYTCGFLLLRYSVCLLLSPCICFISFLYLDSYVLWDDAFMQTKHLCVLIHIWTKGEVGTPLNRFKPSSKILLLTVPRRCFFCGSFMLFLLCNFCLVLFWFALWSPAEKVLTFWLSFVLSNFDVVTFTLASWVRCGAWLYRFQIFAFFLYFMPFSWPSRAGKKICLHFWVHFGIHAQSVYWCVLRRIGVDAKSGNAQKSQN